MLECRVKQTYLAGVVRALGGRLFSKREWSPVPVGLETEAKNHALLDIRERPAEEVKPAEVKISKAALTLAKENKVDTALIAGTGKEGAITVGDVKKFVAELEEGDND